MSEIGINPDLDYLYDLQQARHYGFCKRCHREIYRPGTDLCYRCLEVSYGDEE